MESKHIDMGIQDTGKRPKVSVVLGVRNEYPVILGTILSFVEELEFWGYPWEVIVVDNMSTDSTADILLDKFRRWVRDGSLKVIEYNDRPANVTVRNIGARAATGDVVFLADGHLSIAPGTCHGMIQGWLERGGLWHSAIHIWGDTRDIRCYGYDLKLRERFWGNLSRGVPAEVSEDPKSRNPVPKVPFYRVPMASHCCLMAGREEYLEFGGYCENFRCYGGGEPYLDLKWWLFGSEVYIFAKGLVRHAFGVNPRWEKAVAGRMRAEETEAVKKYLLAPDDKAAIAVLRTLPQPVHKIMRELRGDKAKPADALKELAKQWPKKVRNYVHKRNRDQSSWLLPGEEYLRYSRGYAWDNEMFQFNFMLSAYTIGGYPWLQQRYEVYYEGRKGNPRYVEDIQKLRREVLAEGRDDRQFIEQRQVCTLDELLEREPWKKFDDL